VKNLTKGATVVILVKREPNYTGSYDGQRVTDRFRTYVWDAQARRWWKLREAPQRFQSVDFERQKERDNPRSSAYVPQSNRRNRESKKARDKRRDAEMNTVRAEARTYATGVLNDENLERVQQGGQARTAAETTARRAEVEQYYIDEYLRNRPPTPLPSPSPPRKGGRSRKDRKDSPPPPGPSGGVVDERMVQNDTLWR
jgi:hypothetical protein